MDSFNNHCYNYEWDIYCKIFKKSWKLISGNIFIAGGGQFKIAKMIENTGIDLSALNQISDVEIDNNLQSLMSLEEVVTREDASESFEALEH